MPRTVGTIDGTPNLKRLSVRLIDVSGDRIAEAVELGLAATEVQIEAMIADYAARTNANIYAVEVTDVYFSPAIASSANGGDKSQSVKDGINFLFVSNTNESDDFRLVAPTAAQMVDDTDSVDPTEAGAFAALVTPLLSGTKSPVSAQYTERKEKQNNPKTAL